MKYIVSIDKNTIEDKSDVSEIIKKMRNSIMTKITEESCNPEDYFLTLHNEELELVMTAELRNK